MYGQGQPLHPCYQVLHAVHGGEVLHHSETVACQLELAPRSWSPLCSHCHVPPFKCGESESPVRTS